jgi:hypothetical protein
MCDSQVWKPAIRQTWKSALRFGNGGSPKGRNGPGSAKGYAGQAQRIENAKISLRTLRPLREAADEGIRCSAFDVGCSMFPAFVFPLPFPPLLFTFSVLFTRGVPVSIGITRHSTAPLNLQHFRWARIAQLDRASDYGSEGFRFNS